MKDSPNTKLYGIKLRELQQMLLEAGDLNFDWFVFISAAKKLETLQTLIKSE